MGGNVRKGGKAGGKCKSIGSNHARSDGCIVRTLGRLWLIFGACSVVFCRPGLRREVVLRNGATCRSSANETWVRIYRIRPGLVHRLYPRLRGGGPQMEMTTGLSRGGIAQMFDSGKDCHHAEQAAEVAPCYQRFRSCGTLNVTDDLLREAHEQETKMLAEEMREEQLAKKMELQGSGAVNAPKDSHKSFKQQRMEGQDSQAVCSSSNSTIQAQMSLKRHELHDSIETEQLLQLALDEEMRLLTEEAAAERKSNASSPPVCSLKCKDAEGDGGWSARQQNISESTRRLLVQAFNEEMLMLELEGHPLPAALCNGVGSATQA